jgi:hypothetical protein
LVLNLLNLVVNFFSQLLIQTIDIMKKFRYFVILLAAVSCKNYRSGIPSQSDSNIQRYTYSMPYDIDFNVCGATYSIIYDYSRAIDTALLYSGIFEIGKDSLLYVQVRTVTDELDLYNDKTHQMQGDVTQLTLYDGKRFRGLTPPYYDPFFSAFTLDNNDLYYWGLSEDSTFACKYNIKTRDLKKVFLTTLNWGTDYLGVFNTPQKYDKYYFEFQSEITNRSWLINDNFDKVIRFRLDGEDPIPFENQTDSLF